MGGPKSERILQLLFNILLWNVNEFLFPPLILFLTFNPRITKLRKKLGETIAKPIICLKPMSTFSLEVSTQLI